MDTFLYIAIGLGSLVVVSVFFLLLLAFREVATGKGLELEYLDDDEFDENSNLKPLLGVVSPKEKK